MIGIQEIAQQAKSYLSGSLDVREFRDVLVGFRLDHELDADAKQLIADIEGRYAEFSDELVSETFLQDRLRLLFGESIMTGTSIVLHPPAGTLRAGAAPAWEFVSAG
jgi:hypothetical protein